MGLIVTDAPDLKINEFYVAKRAAEKLVELYPGYLWTANVTQGILDIRNVSLSGQWGFTIHACKSYSSSDLDRKVMLAGGEILERYRQRRGSIDHNAIAALPTDHRGLYVPELG